jgi:hypothetical protein
MDNRVCYCTAMQKSKWVLIFLVESHNRVKD